jgi:hypothetical protein
LPRDRWIAHVEEGSDACSPRHELGDQLDPLRVDLGDGRAQARDVPARARETGDDALGHRVADAGDHDRNRRRGMLGRERRRRPSRQDQVHPELSELGR